MICETIFTLAENFEHPYRQGRITKQAQTGIRHWIDSIYDNAWKKQQDEWMIREGVISMFLDGIQFLVLPNLLWPFDPDNHNLWRDAFPKLIPDHFIQLDTTKSPQAICGSYPFSGDDPGYHSGPEGQEKIAENFYQHISTHFVIP
jgi:hypothetical protein